ncbi:MAG: hypothetical protein NZ740_03410 [Kiritimatiellae bacterium]|nr:hypothetical protein [Kiritimatiellia bacterium]MDW8458139.1 hypothetical protein [Verrucomicrobiota bacterium]
MNIAAIPRLAVLGAWVVCLGVPLSSAEPRDRAETSRTLLSASRRFVVSGLPAPRAFELARWAEEVAERIQRVTGVMTFTRGEFILIDVSEPEGPPFVTVSQTCDGGDISQSLRLGGLPGIDREEAESALVSLLLSRQIHTLQPRAERCPDPVLISDWISVAVAHATDPDIRRRDLDAALVRHQGGELSGFREITGFHVMPRGRHPIKADATALWLWLSDTPDGGSALLKELVRIHAEGRRPDPEWLARWRTGESDVAAATRAWHDWLEARAARLVFPARHLSDEWMDSLRVAPLTELVEAGGPADLAGRPLIDLVRLRKEPWCKNFAVRRAIRMRLEAVGQEDEALQVVDAYARFLEGLAKGLARRRLDASWKEAETRLHRYQRMREARRRFLDEVEERLGLARNRSEDPVNRFLQQADMRTVTGN